ncbi:MAG: GrxA family glutaredoxin [Pseudomonadota bacterium]|nr:GrxA family glutaredoxin [Pseudomonadota bacterium]
MEQVTIYGRSSCGFCNMARQLCEIRNYDYRYIDMVEEGIAKEDLARQFGFPVRTVPQIFVGDEYIGGFDDFSGYLRREEATA